MNTGEKDIRTEKERQQAAVSIHIGAVNAEKFIEIHDNNIVNLYTSSSSARPIPPSEQRVKDTLERLLAATDAAGRRIFMQQYQWYAVWKVLQEYQYPKNFQTFADTMQTLLGTTDPPCKAESIRKIGNDVPHAAESLAVWRTLQGKADGQLKSLIEVALRLQELLAQG